MNVSTAHYSPGEIMLKDLFNNFQFFESKIRSCKEKDINIVNSDQLEIQMREVGRETRWKERL